MVVKVEVVEVVVKVLVVVVEEVLRCEGVRPPAVPPLPADKGCDHCQPGELLRSQHLTIQTCRGVPLI